MHIENTMITVGSIGANTSILIDILDRIFVYYCIWKIVPRFYVRFQIQLDVIVSFVFVSKLV